MDLRRAGRLAVALLSTWFVGAMLGVVWKYAPLLGVDIQHNDDGRGAAHSRPATIDATRQHDLLVHVALAVLFVSVVVLAYECIRAFIFTALRRLRRRPSLTPDN